MFSVHRSVIRVTFFVLSGLLAIPFFAAGNSAARSEITAYMAGTEYFLGVNDMLNIHVFNEPELSGQFQVQANGTINMPLIGIVHIAGQTPENAKDLIETKLSQGYLINPDVSLEIAEHRSFYIMGEVKNPGQYEYQGDLTAMGAVAIAGGFTYRAKRKQFKLMRTPQDNDYQKIQTNAAISPGDILLIEERFF